MRGLMLICIVFSLLSCKDELDGECSSPFKITVEELRIIDYHLAYSIDVNKNSKWWVNSIRVNGKELEIDKSITTTNNFLYDSELFILEKISDDTMKLYMKENYNSTKVVVGLQSGNCFSNFAIN